MKKDINKNLLFLNLENVRTTNPLIFKEVKNWIKSLTDKSDFEDGDDFTKFVNKNLKLRHPFGVFILFSPDINDTVGIVSVVPDDQNVEKENNLDKAGIWIGGLNIKKQYRGMGYGTAFFKKLDDYLLNLNKKNQVSLFANNPVALKIYKKFGFKKTGLKVYKPKENIVYTKIYFNNL